MKLQSWKDEKLNKNLIDIVDLRIKRQFRLKLKRKVQIILVKIKDENEFYEHDLYLKIY